MLCKCYVYTQRVNFVLLNEFWFFFHYFILSKNKIDYFRMLLPQWCQYMNLTIYHKIT